MTIRWLGCPRCLYSSNQYQLLPSATIFIKQFPTSNLIRTPSSSNSSSGYYGSDLFRLLAAPRLLAHHAWRGRWGVLSLGVDMKGWQNKSMVEISEEFQQLCDFGRAKELFRWCFFVWSFGAQNPGSPNGWFYWLMGSQWLGSPWVAATLLEYPESSRARPMVS